MSPLPPRQLQKLNLSAEQKIRLQNGLPHVLYLVLISSPCSNWRHDPVQGTSLIKPLTLERLLEGPQALSLED